MRGNTSLQNPEPQSYMRVGAWPAPPLLWPQGPAPGESSITQPGTDFHSSRFAAAFAVVLQSIETSQPGMDILYHCFLSFGFWLTNETGLNVFGD